MKFTPENPPKKPVNESIKYNVFKITVVSGKTDTFQFTPPFVVFKILVPYK